MQKSDLTAVILTKNEEKNLGECLDNLSWVKEIIVVDDFSTDETVKIAKKFSARVYQRRLDNFSSQRNWALNKVKTKWVLMIDADERVTPEFRKEVEKVIKEDKYDGFRFPRKNIIFGKWIKHTGWYPDWQLHLFKTKKGKYQGKVHEQLILEGKVGEINVPLVHYNYHSISQYLQKLDRYTTLTAEILREKNYKFEYQDLIIKPAEEFFRRFFVEKGWKDGIHGLALCLLQAFSELVVYLKIWEKEKFREVEIKDYSLSFEKVINNYFWWRSCVEKFPKKFWLKIKSKI
ncbi:MAG: glycosyltransferase family 2 protein [Microgenomates group bacterium]